MRIEIASGLVRDLIALAAADPAREVCGLLFGDAGRIDGYRAAANIAADPATMFEIDPATLIAAHRAARAGGPAMIGCYHSHPTGVAQPSARDRAGAEPGQYWIIIAGADARLFQADDAADFRPIPLPST